MKNSDKVKLRIEKTKLFFSNLRKRFLGANFLKKILLKPYEKKDSQVILSENNETVVQSNKKLSKANIAKMVSRKDDRTIKVTKLDGGELSPKSKRKAANLYHKQLSHTPVKKNTQGVLENSKGEQYFESMSTDKMLISLPITPQKERLSLQSSYKQEPKKTLEELKKLLHGESFGAKFEKFEFSVTQAEFKERMNCKRDKTQNQVMKGSAKEALRTLGVIISEKDPYHWAHRHGHALGGAQSAENLDPATAGSNYDTLVKVETPIYNLLQDKKIDKVFVRGLVVFHTQTRVPLQILYCVSSAESKKYYVSIDPLNPRVPTLGELSFSVKLAGDVFVSPKEPEDNEFVDEEGEPLAKRLFKISK